MIKAIIILTLVYSTARIGDPALNPESQVPRGVRTGLSNGNGDKRLSGAQLRIVLDSLRHKTGFSEIVFDESGFLTLGDRRNVNGGSETARALLIAAVDGNQAIELEDYDRSPEVAFARITSGIVYTNFQTKERISVRKLHLDFSDFAELRGESEARAAFDLGFAVLHELVHGVLGLSDPADGATELGACDERINFMRRELNLPERRGYRAQTWEMRYGTAGTKRQAELIFARQGRPLGGSGKRWFYLRWDRERVAYAE